MNLKDLSVEELFTMEHPEKILEGAKPFAKLMMQYRCAMLEVQTKLEVLNAEMSLEQEHNPFESIKCRIKSPTSIVGKLRRKGLPISIKSIENNIFDIAGIRVICSFPDDIYTLAASLCAQDDITVLEKTDYIANPKESGYRSLHLVISIPIFLSDTKKHVPVEVQFRTIAMDFWASLEHKVRYKKNIDNTEEIASELKACADMITEADYRMQAVRDAIEQQKK